MAVFWLLLSLSLSFVTPSRSFVTNAFHRRVYRDSRSGMIGLSAHSPRSSLALASSPSHPHHLRRPIGISRAAPTLVASDGGRSPLGPSNAAFALAWLALVVYAFAFSPGAVNDPADSEMVMKLVSSPTSPIAAGVSPIFAFVFNLFLPVPLMIASLLLPRYSTGQRVPALPFVAASAFAGYFALGPFLVLASKPPPRAAGEPVPFAFFETHAFAAATAAVCLSLPVSSQLLEVADWPAALDAFGELLRSSKLASVSAADLSVLCVVLALLVREDAQERGLAKDADALCAVSLLLPAFGPAAWLLLRPEPADSELE